MGILLSKQLGSGYIANYARVVRADIQCDGRTEIMLAWYKDEQTRKDMAEPVRHERIETQLDVEILKKIYAGVKKVYPEAKDAIDKKKDK